jgi:diguanylate cyclase
MTTVLIADDLDVSRRRLSILLGLQGYRVVEAEDGDEALRIVKSERPDLAIIDLLMPAMDGFEFVRAVRDDPAIAQTPVIFFSANFLPAESTSLALTLGVRYVLEKSCAPDQILDAVRESMTSSMSSAVSVNAEEFNREHTRLITSKLAEGTRGFVAALGDLLHAEGTPPPSGSEVTPDSAADHASSE